MLWNDHYLITLKILILMELQIKFYKSFIHIRVDYFFI